MCKEDSIDCKIVNFQTEGNVIMLHKHPNKSVLFKLFHLLSTNPKLISQYRLTYTLYSGLNHVNYLKKERKIKMKTLGKDAFSINKDTVDLRYVEQIADTEQTTALGYALLYAKLHLMDGKKDLCAVADELMQMIETKGLSALLDSKYVKSNLAMPRKQEVMAAMNRYRNL